MVGTIVIIIVLLLGPVLILMSSTIFAAVFGEVLNRDVDKSHEGSELLALSRSGRSIP